MESATDCLSLPRLSLLRPLLLLMETLLLLLSSLFLLLQQPLLSSLPPPTTLLLPQSLPTPLPRQSTLLPWPMPLQLTTLLLLPATDRLPWPATTMHLQSTN